MDTGVAWITFAGVLVDSIPTLAMHTRVGGTLINVCKMKKVIMFIGLT